VEYKVYQGNELKQTVTSTTAVMNGLQPNTAYEFGVTPNNGSRDGEQKTTNVTTRGIRFNIPKTLTVGSTITLRYEEYPLGIIPIGNEPSGMFGGGNRKNLSAKVISTANGISVVEVAGNVIDVGGRNLISGSYDSSWSYTSLNGTVEKVTMDSGEVALHVIGYDGSGGFWEHTDLPSGTYTVSVEVKGTGTLNKLGWEVKSDAGMTPTSDWQRVSRTAWIDGNYWFAFVFYGKMDAYVRLLKLEQGSISTPYAAFVDGDTFTAQPDGTYALFSEYKALYY